MSNWLWHRMFIFRNTATDVTLFGAIRRRSQNDISRWGLPSIGEFCHLLEAILFHLVEVVPPHGALDVELLDFFVDQLFRVLSLMMLPASLNQSRVVFVLRSIVKKREVVPSGQKVE